MNYRSYLLSLRPYLIFSLLVLMLAFFWGYLSAQTSPEEAKKVLSKLAEIFGPINEMGPFSQLLVIFLNNALTAFLALILGLALAIPPLMIVFSNGVLLGLLAFFIQDAASWKLFLAGILPHGIIELPLIILVVSIGFKLGWLVLKKIFKKDNEIVKEINLALIFFLRIILPLLLLAALLEVFITPLFLH